MAQSCFICSKPLTEGEIVVVNRGMKTLIDSSVERNDDHFKYLKDKQSVTIHVQCRKVYTRKNSIAATKTKHENERVRTSTISPEIIWISSPRVIESVFCFKKHCLFCGGEANEEAEKKKAQKSRRKISHVSSFAFRDSILKRARTRSDDVAKAVIARVEFEYDLVANEAKYHGKCYNSFLKPKTGGKIGRPEDKSITTVMKELFAYIENSDACQFPWEELKIIWKNVPVDNRTIKARLKLKYGNKIIIETEVNKTIVKYNR